MSMIGEGLARCGASTAASLASVVMCEGLVEPAMVVHPLVDCSSAPVPATAVRAALAMDAPQDVVEHLCTLAPPWVVVAAASHHLPAALMGHVRGWAQAPAGTNGKVEAQFLLLRVGDARGRKQLVMDLAPEAASGSLSQTLTWLVAATSCPDLLGHVREVAAPSLRLTVARFARVAAAGSPVDELAEELVRWIGSRGLVTPDWVTATGGIRAVMSWADAVRCTGLPAVAMAALESCSLRADVCAQVLAHPHLAGSDVAAQARDWLVRELGCGPMPDRRLIERAPLLTYDAPASASLWVGQGHDGVEDVAFAWTMLRRMVAAGEDTRAITGMWADRAMGALELACADRPQGRVWREALPWAREAIGGRKHHTARVAHMRRLLAVAEGVHGGAGLGSMQVGDLLHLREQLGRPTWLGRLLGEFFEGVPQVGDPAFVHGLLAGGDAFTGTLDELVAFATALSA